MWKLTVEGGLHDGAEVELKPGLNRLGSDESADLLLLDPGLPIALLALNVSESGHLECADVAAGVQFSYDGEAWSDARKEPLFAVNSQFRLGDITLRLVRTADPDAECVDSGAEGLSATQAFAAQRGSASFDLSGAHSPLSGASRWLAVHQPRVYRAWLWCTQPLHKKPVLAAVSVTSLLAVVAVIGWTQIRTGADGAGTQHQAPTYVHPSGLALTYQLSVGHQAPPGALTADERVPLLSATDPVPVHEAAGHDSPDGATAMRLSYTLSVGKPVEQVERQAEPAFASLREQLTRHPWGARVTLNALGKQVSVRAQLSEAERREFEKIIQRTVREYGSTFLLKAIVEPLDPIPDLQIKQVMGGDNPVIVLQDGSRLMQGSVYEGLVIESITTSRVVLRGKDRVEVPI